MKVMAGNTKDRADPPGQDVTVTIDPSPPSPQPSPPSPQPSPPAPQPTPLPAGCYMCQIHEVLLREEPAAVPEPIVSAAQAESSMTTLLCCGASSYVMWRYRRTRVVRRFVSWLLAAYSLLLLAFIFFVAMVYLL